MAKRIAHIDMDAFFVSIERRDNPELCGVPVVVGGNSRRGVVCSASYEAREYGIHSGMPTAKAYKLCPHAVFVSTSSGKYGEASRAVRAVLTRFSPDVDFTSVDEGYIDLTGTQRLFGQPMDVAQRIRDEVLRATGCSASLGIAGNRLCAKVASKFSKPAGIIEVAPGREREFLQHLPLELLPGAGGKMGERMIGLGITRVRHLLDRGEPFLRHYFGAAGVDFFIKAEGGSVAPWKIYRDLPRKSVSHERTFSEDSNDMAFLERVLFHLVERCCRTLRDEGLVCTCVTAKVRHADFRTYSRGRTMLGASDCDLDIFNEARTLLRGLMRLKVPVRLIGVSLSALSPHCQWSLLDNTAKQWRLYRGIDRIRDAYGDAAIVNGLVMNDSKSARYKTRVLNPFLPAKYADAGR